jgi:hypothetical protein
MADVSGFRDDELWDERIEWATELEHVAMSRHAASSE